MSPFDFQGFSNYTIYTDLLTALYGVVMWLVLLWDSDVGPWKDIHRTLLAWVTEFGMSILRSRHDYDVIK